MPVGGMAFFGENQHLRITSTYLNQLNRHGDPGPGNPLTTAQASGSIVQPYDGLQGGKLTLTNAWAAQHADPAVGPLYGGIYQYCRLSPSTSGALSRGQVVFWSPGSGELQYTVTPMGKSGPIHDVRPNKIAGIAVNETLPGNWDFFQIAGIANVLFGWWSSVGRGDLVMIDNSADPPYVPFVRGSFTGAWHQWVIGTVALQSRVNAGEIGIVELNLAPGPNF